MIQPTWSALLSNLRQMGPPKCSIAVVLFKICAPRLLPGPRIEILVSDGVCLFTGTLRESTLDHVGVHEVSSEVSSQTLTSLRTSQQNGYHC
jgi:hypothetical protein